MGTGALLFLTPLVSRTSGLETVYRSRRSSRRSRRRFLIRNCVRRSSMAKWSPLTKMESPAFSSFSAFRNNRQHRLSTTFSMCCGTHANRNSASCTPAAVQENARAGSGPAWHSFRYRQGLRSPVRRSNAASIPGLLLPASTPIPDGAKSTAVLLSQAGCYWFCERR